MDILPEVSVCSCNPLREKYIFSFLHLLPAEKINVVFLCSNIWNALLSPMCFAPHIFSLHPLNDILLSDLLKTASSKGLNSKPDIVLSESISREHQLPSVTDVREICRLLTPKDLSDSNEFFCYTFLKPDSCFANTVIGELHIEH